MATAPTAAKSLEGEPGISRIDQASKRTHGWFARVYLHGKTLSKFFADKAHGGSREALLAARKHRLGVLAAARGEGESAFGSLYLTRMDYARAKGWWVRVSVGGGKQVTRLFSDSEFGSADAAREAAGKWRDAVAVHHGVAARPGFRPSRTRRPRPAAAPATAGV